MTSQSWSRLSTNLSTAASPREIDDLIICFYGGEPLLKNRVIYKIMDMFPKARFCLQVVVVFVCDVDECNAPEDSEGRLSHEDGHNSLFHRWSSRDHEPVSRRRYLRADHGERGVHQGEGLPQRPGGAYDGERGAERRHLRRRDAYPLPLAALLHPHTSSAWASATCTGSWTATGTLPRRTVWPPGVAGATRATTRASLVWPTRSSERSERSTASCPSPRSPECCTRGTGVDDSSADF